MIDSHAHLTGDQIYPDIDAILERAKEAGVEKIVNICTDDETLERGIKIRNKYPWVYNVASTTPHDVVKDGERLFSFMAEHAKAGNLVAIGETGLDYYYHDETKDLQQHFLKKYLHLALETELPVVIHCRDAFQDFFNILDAEYKISGKYAPGVLHCFTGTVPEAEEVIKRGWYLSLSGIVTFKKSVELQSVAKIVPLDQLLIETDAPYLAPGKYRGKQNEPSYIVETAHFLSDLMDVPVETLIEATANNAKNLFSLN